MIKHFCDSCNKETNFLYDIDIALSPYFAGEWHYAVCKQCKKKMLKFLTGKEDLGDRIERF